MEDKTLKKLSRSDLLEIMISVSKENEALQIENNQLKQALQQRKIALDNAGSIAKASLEINGVMESAQKAADQYLFNIKAMADDIRGKIRDEIMNAQKEADEIRAKAMRDAEVIRAGGTPAPAPATTLAKPAAGSPSQAATTSPKPAAGDPSQAASGSPPQRALERAPVSGPQNVPQGGARRAAQTTPPSAEKVQEGAKAQPMQQQSAMDLMKRMQGKE